METKMHKTTIKALALAVMTVYSGYGYTTDFKSKYKGGDDVTSHYEKTTPTGAFKERGPEVTKKTAAESTSTGTTQEDADAKGKAAAEASAETKAKEESKKAAYLETDKAIHFAPGSGLAVETEQDSSGDKITDPDKHRTKVTMGGHVIHDVHSAVQDSDAANLGDVKRETKEAVAGMKDSITTNASDIKAIDQRTKAVEKKTKELDDSVKQLKGDLHHVDKRASRGIASAMASAGLDLASKPGEYAISVGTATYRGNGALAVGASMRSVDGHWGTNASVNLNNDDVGATLSVGYHW